MAEAVELRLALPEQDLLDILGHDALVQIKKRRAALSTLKVDVLKRIIKLYNTENDLRPRSAEYVKSTGRKDELIDSVSRILYMEVEGTPTSPPAPTPILQKRALPESPSYPHLKMPRSASPTASPTLPRGNAIIPPKTERKVWWENDQDDFYRAQSPFWKEEAQLEVVFIEPRLDHSHFPFYYREHSFSVPDLNDVHAGKKVIHFRLYHKHSKIDYEWNQTHDLQLNRTPVQFVRKKTRTAPVKQPFVIPPPVIVPLNVLKARNRISFNCPREFYGYLVVQLVSKRSLEEIVESVPVIKDAGSNRSGDDDLAEVSLKVGVRCPLSFTRIEKPARGVYCTHIQCFDLESYLLFCQQQSIWYCSICYRSLPPRDLRRDEYFQSILDYVGDDDSDDDIKVEINEDGTFQKSSLVNIPQEQPAPPPAPTPAPLASSQGAEEESQADSQPHSMANSGSFICLLDSDSEEETRDVSPPSPPPFRGVQRPATSFPDPSLFPPRPTATSNDIRQHLIVSLSSDSDDEHLGW